jgi:hypothetical protein
MSVATILLDHDDDVKPTNRPKTIGRYHWIRFS